jgi:four helix bundle protein
MNSQELKNRTKLFAHRCVKAGLSLPENKLGKHVAAQLIRSSTSVAANYRAVCIAQSKAAFSAKLSIVIEEADESEFWLEFALDEKLFKSEQVNELIKEANELCNIFMASRKTVHNRQPAV